MKIAVLSDIHGNYIALQTCVKYALAQEISTFIFLGDYVGELAYPERTMSLIYELSKKYQCFFIRGNKEDYWINYRNCGEIGWYYNHSTTGSLLYTYNHLTAQDITFFEGLPISNELLFEGLPAFTICHGSPDNNRKKLLAKTNETCEIMKTSPTKLILCGHTHVQAKIEENGTKVLNPGSVGVPLFSKGKTQFLILHGNAQNHTWHEEFISLTYNVEKVIQELHLSDLDKYAPYWCQITVNLLQTGLTSHGLVLQKAMELCQKETGSCTWPNIPEKYYKQALSMID